MKKLRTLAIVIVLVGCSEGGYDRDADPATGANNGQTTTPGYVTSQPLVDNSNASTYKVLLMGNSHAAGLKPTLDRLLILGQPGKSVDVQVAPNSGFLVDRVNDGVSEQKLESEQWTHVILQAQKYSSTGSITYPTTAAEYWVRGSKEMGATPIMFPEHPRKGNTLEGRTLWELHSGISTREDSCVAPVGLVWDEVIFRDNTLTLHLPDGNHASEKGLLLSAMVFYQIITDEPADALPSLSDFGIDSATELIMRESVSSILLTYPQCAYEE